MSEAIYQQLVIGTCIRRYNKTKKEEREIKDIDNHIEIIKEKLKERNENETITSDEDEEEEEDGERSELFSTLKKKKKEEEEEKENIKKKSKEQLSRLMEIKQFRKKMQIHTYGKNIPEPMDDFMKLLNDSMSAVEKKMMKIILRNIEESEYKVPTPIQMQAIPAILQGNDVLGIAPTGSGKTAAFVIPSLCQLCKSNVDDKNNNDKEIKGIRSLIVSPTRELAVQLLNDIKRLSNGLNLRTALLTKATVPTVSKEVTNHHLSYDVLVTTPMRLIQMVQKKTIDLSNVEILCLDEADRLFATEFLAQIDEIIAACSSPNIQRLMFSATMLENVEELAQTILRESIKVVIGKKNAGADTVEQKLIFAGKEEGKLIAMRKLVHEGLKVPVLIFVQNIERAKELHNELVYEHLKIDVIHSERTKEQRDKVIEKFHNGQIWVLICTDLLCRGIDFKGVNMVINWDFPQSAVSYIHRIGRTGRAGKQGLAVTFFTESDMSYLRSIANVMRLSGCDVPEWMLNIKKMKTNAKKRLLKKPPQRRRITTVSSYDLQKINKKRQRTEKQREINRSKRE